MRFTSELSLIDLDLRGYERAVDRELTEKTKEAARSWLRTVLVIIPTWSGASRATFEDLASKVGFNVTYGPQRSFKNRRPLGRATGRGNVSREGHTWFFTYETDLRYLAYNEFNHVVFGQAPNVFRREGLLNPTPYRFQEAGRKDFESFAQTVRLPSPFNFIRGRRI